MAKFSFKSAGKTAEIKKKEEIAKTPKPIGIVTPLRLSKNSTTWATHSDIGKQIRDNFRNLLLTNHGERLGQYDFGANLRELALELTSTEEFDSEAIQRIKTATSKWMPYVELDEFVSSVDYQENKTTGTTVIKVKYNVPSVGVFGDVVEVSVHVT